MRQPPIHRRIAQGRAPTRNIMIALAVGVLCAVLCYTRLMLVDRGAGGLHWALDSATQLFHGQNPYYDPAIQAGAAYPFSDRLLYPLPALLLALPLTLLPAAVAGALFAGLTVGLLCWGISRDGWRLWPILLSAPLWSAVTTAHWTPLLVAAALLPTLLPLTLAQPNAGLPLLLATPSPQRCLRSLLALLGGALVLPVWLWTWLGSAHPAPLFIPLLTIPGACILLAAWRWRDRRARLLLFMALMPQRALVDQLGLWLVARSWRQALALAIGSWIAAPGWWSGAPLTPGWIVVGLYGPALAISLWPAIAARWMRWSVWYRAGSAPPHVAAIDAPEKVVAAHRSLSAASNLWRRES